MDINMQRFKSEFEQISRFGALAGGGLTRLAFSREDKAARDFLISLLQKENFKIKIDDAGNIFAKFGGVKNPDLPSVSAGSHIDSVPQGGFYDGTLGVMAALEAIRTVRDSGERLARPLELIVFVCEESSRFKMATVGSKIISGKLSRQRLGELKDKDGISLFDAMESFGLNPANLKSCALRKSSFHSYIELHIEQGPVLQRRGIPVGIVTGIAAPVRYELRIEGRADHSGATPMDMRCDALACASEIVLSAERIAKEGKTTVATTGYANAIPGVLNVIPGSCTLGLDIRDIDEEALRAADDEICAAIGEICARRGCKFELKNLIKDRPVKLSEEMIDLLESCAGELKIPSLRLPSGAGHDAMNMTELADRVGMLFVPCKDGISHNVFVADMVKAHNPSYTVQDVIGVQFSSAITALIVVLIVISITAIVCKDYVKGVNFLAQRENSAGVDGASSTAASSAASAAGSNLDAQPQKINVLYALMPLVPLVILIIGGTSKLNTISFLKWTKMGVAEAMLLGAIVTIVITLSNPQKITKEFFKGMGSAYADIMGIIIAAGVFVAGLSACGAIDFVIEWLKGEQGYVKFGGTFVPFFMGVVTGSGDAASMAFNTAVTVHADALGFEQDKLGMAVAISGALGRSASPIAGACIVCAGLAMVSPIQIAKRTALGMFLSVCVIAFFIL